MQVAVTIVKVALIVLIVVAGLGWGNTRGITHAAALVHLTVLGFFAALVSSLWAYDGWNNVSMVASEIRQPQRNLPLALIWGTAAVIGIYLLANMAYFYVLTPAQVAGSNRVAADHDAAGARAGRGEPGLGGRHDLHVRRFERLDPFRRPRSLRHWRATAISSLPWPASTSSITRPGSPFWA